MTLPLLVALVGPTGSGKSDLGIRLAQESHGEIVNCDSMQIYRRLDIGTGKLPVKERLDVPHHLIDVADPDDFFSAGEFATTARRVLGEIRARTRLPIIVGGTGLYLRALLQGLFEGPARSPELRARMGRVVERGGLARLHRLLARIDPVAAARIMPRDKLRIIRAVEVYVLTGRPISAHFANPGAPLEGFRVLQMGLNPPRPDLYERTNRRVVAMLERGWIDEVRGLRAAGLTAECHGFSALGYRRIVEFLDGRLPEKELVERIQADTRHYAKRQWTWFRGDARTRWLDGFGDDPQIQRQAAEWVQNEL